MDDNKRNRRTGWGDYITSTISVTLVLFILGLVGAINITFHGVDRHVKERMGFTVVLTDSVPSATVEAIKRECAAAPYISSYQYLSAEEVMAEETRNEGAELVELLGVNPYAPMLEVKVKEQYANLDSINRIASAWQNRPEVGEVTVNAEMIDNLNRNAGFLNTILIIIAGALLLISFVLINNTVRLTVYSRRFLIHTMKLVGATGAFIRRPFLLANMWQGIIAGILASGLLAAIMAWGESWQGGAVVTFLPWSSVGILCGAMVVVGIIICTFAALLATNRYLRKNYDEMFE